MDKKITFKQYEAALDKAYEYVKQIAREEVQDACEQFNEIDHDYNEMWEEQLNTFQEDLLDDLRDRFLVQY